MIEDLIQEEKLTIHWTPEQISAELKNTYNIYASYELIYQYLAFDREQGVSHKCGPDDFKRIGRDIEVSCLQKL